MAISDPYEIVRLCSIPQSPPPLIDTSKEKMPLSPLMEGRLSDGVEEGELSESGELFSSPAGSAPFPSLARRVALLTLCSVQRGMLTAKGRCPPRRLLLSAKE